ncbi:hypothetical protein JOD69_004997, partial [Methylocaldum sp. RMAD-M]|nr:hypothetical protein [Methylocaldum sp. RMAD-M]
RQRLAQRLGPMISRRFCLLWNPESRYKVGNPFPIANGRFSRDLPIANGNFGSTKVPLPIANGRFSRDPSNKALRRADTSARDCRPTYPNPLHRFGKRSNRKLGRCASCLRLTKAGYASINPAYIPVEEPVCGATPGCKIVSRSRALFSRRPRPCCRHTMGKMP